VAQVLATTPGPQAESSGTLTLVEQMFALHCATSAVPWHAVGASHVGGVE